MSTLTGDNGVAFTGNHYNYMAGWNRKLCFNDWNNKIEMNYVEDKSLMWITLIFADEDKSLMLIKKFI